MRALVTGGTGYLGSFLVRQWAAKYGAGSVVCLVPPEGSPAETATRDAFLREGIACIEGDLRRRPVAEGLGGRWDALVHLAAATDTSWPESRLAPVNVEGTANLLESLNGQMRGKRVLLTSTSAAVDRVRRPRGRPLTEDSPCRPRTAYGRTKLAAEHIVKDWCAREGATYTIARLTTLYGPGVRTGLVPVLAEGLRQGKLAAAIDWPGRASMLFVEDAVRLLVFLAESSRAANETFFLSSGEAVRIGDVARRVAQAVNPGRKLIGLPGWCWRLACAAAWTPGLNRLVPWRLLHILDDGLWCDNARVRRLYPERLVPLEEGLTRTFASPPEFPATAGAGATSPPAGAAPEGAPA
jgi:UDP-glucose 4-epimerase